MKTTLKETAYHHIRSKLLSHELPPGSPISHRELAREIGVSFTPVRDAIGQLTVEGLLETHPTRGTVVVEMTRDDLIELYEVREALECHAVAKSAGKLRDTEIAELERYTEVMEQIAAEAEQSVEKILAPEQSDRWMIADAGFHVALLRTAGNRRAIRIVNDLRVMVRIFGHRKREELYEGELRHICEEHRRLILAVREGDGAAARDVLAGHLQHGCHRALAAFDRSRMEEAAGHGSWVTYPPELQGRIQRLQEKAEED